MSSGCLCHITERYGTCQIGLVNLGLYIFLQNNCNYFTSDTIMESTQHTCITMQSHRVKPVSAVQ